MRVEGRGPAVWIALSVAHAADLEGASMPDARVVEGTQMPVERHRASHLLRARHPHLCGRSIS